MFIDALSRGAGNHTLVALAPLALAPPPTLSSLRVSPRTFSVAGRTVRGHCVKPTKRNRTHKRCRRPVKLRVSYTLSTPATTAVVLQRQSPGRKVKAGCVEPNKKNNKHQKCTRLTLKPGTITRTGTQGPNSFTFDGKIGGRTLGTGSYQLTATAPANGRTGTPQTATFTLSP